MKKLFLLLFLPLLMVTAAFSYNFEGGESDYEGEDVVIEFREFDDNTFRYVISNLTDDDIYIDFEESYYCALDDDWEEIDGTQTLLFDEDEIEDYVDVIESGNFLASEPLYFSDDISLAGFYFLIEIGGEEYEFSAVISDY